MEKTLEVLMSREKGHGRMKEEDSCPQAGREASGENNPESGVLDLFDFGLQVSTTVRK